MNLHYTITTAHEVRDPINGDVVCSTELRVTFVFRPGSSDTWDCPGDPEEVEHYSTQRRDGKRWVAAPEFDVWAEAWMAEHMDELRETVAADTVEAAEYRAECRRDAWRAA